MTSPHEEIGDFAAEAEVRRAAGDARAAREVALRGLESAPGDSRCRVALALALIDLGDLTQARRELGRVVASAAADARPDDTEIGRRPDSLGAAHPELPGATENREFEALVGEDEIETAFEAAETDPDEMMDANRVVERTLLDADDDVSSARADDESFDVADHPTYATRTMAALLASQGAEAQADRLRQALGWREEETEEDLPMLDAAHALAIPSGESGVMGEDLTRRLRVVATLESWLHNLRRNAERDAACAAATAGRSASNTQ